jgi:hypothetical protein
LNVLLLFACCYALLDVLVCAWVMRPGLDAYHFEPCFPAKSLERVSLKHSKMLQIAICFSKNNWRGQSQPKRNWVRPAKRGSGIFSRVDLEQCQQGPMVADVVVLCAGPGGVR